MILNKTKLALSRIQPNEGDYRSVPVFAEATYWISMCHNGHFLINTISSVT